MTGMFEDSVEAGGAAFQELFRTIELQAADALRSSLASHRGEEPPDEIGETRDRFVRELKLSLTGTELLRRMDALDLDLQAIEDEDLLIAATSAWFYPESAGQDQSAGAEPSTLECVDWMPVVAFLATEGVGADASPDRLAAMALTKHAVGQRPDIGSPEFVALEAAFADAIPVWELVGVTSDSHLTEAGRWLLPRSFVQAWGRSFDED